MGCEGTEGFFRLDNTCIDLGTKQHAAMREDGHTQEGLLFQLIKESSYTLVLLNERFSSRGCYM